MEARKQPFDSDVYIKGPLTVATDLTPEKIRATLHLEQSQDESKDLVRLVRANNGGLKIGIAAQAAQLQGLTATHEPGMLVLNSVGGDVQLGSADSQVSVPGEFTIGRGLSVAGDLHLAQKLLEIAGDLAVKGKINGRMLADDLQKLDDHAGATHNPHGVTATQVGALPSAGGILSGGLTVQGDLHLAQKLFVHRNGQEIEVDLLEQPLSDGKLAGSLTVRDELLILNDTNPIKFTSGYTRFPDSGSSNRAEISNDNQQFKTLMIVGNQSQGIAITKRDGKKHTMRRVSVWDRLEVNGPEPRAGQLVVDGNLTVTGKIFQQLANGETASPTSVQMVEQGDVTVALSVSGSIHIGSLKAHATEVALQNANVNAPVLITCSTPDESLLSDDAISWELRIKPNQNKYFLRIYGETNNPLSDSARHVTVHYQVYQLTDS